MRTTETETETIHDRMLVMDFMAMALNLSCSKLALDFKVAICSSLAPHTERRFDSDPYR